MANLYFRFGSMNSSKSLSLLSTRHNYISIGSKVQCLTPSVDDRSGVGVIKSRAIEDGVTATVIYPHSNIQDLVEKVDVILVDEAQFLTSAHIEQLWLISIHTPVICYGLKTDFRGELFPSSARLLALADKVEEIPTICCICKSKKARFNMRLVDGKATFSGEQIKVGDSEYKSVCKYCFDKAKNEKYLDEVICFGKYIGKTFCWVKDNDIKYYRWLQEKELVK